VPRDIGQIGVDPVAMQRTDVFGAMRADLERVEARVVEAATVQYPLAAGLLIDIVKAGGKRLRPLMLLLAGRGYSYDLDTLVTAAAGIEMLHTASLVHDDTVDRAAIRRGRPTLNSRLGTGAVILIGDFLFAQSAMLAAATDSTRVVSIFAASLGEICDGQLLEMFVAHRLDQSRDEYEKRIYGKTASLFAASTEMGAVIGKAPEAHIQSLRQFGGDFGLAFQIVDDILDLTQDSGDIGKPAGNDLRQGTVTLPTLIYADMIARGSDAERTLRAVVEGEASDDATIEHVVSEIRRSGAIEGARDVAAEFTESAKRAASVVPDADTRDMLFEVADLALQRLV
jgi:geranylgeranyl pyrophosphate synthase